MNPSNLALLWGVVLLFIVLCRTDVDSYQNYKTIYDLDISDECERKILIDLGLSYEYDDEACMDAYDNIRNGVPTQCTKSELHKIKDLVCGEKDPFKRWDSLQVSDKCIAAKKYFFQHQWFHEEKDCKLASYFLMTLNDEGYMGCTNKELRQLTNVVCKGNNPFKKWLDLKVRTNCSDTKIEIFRTISGLSTDQVKDCKDVSEYLLQNDNSFKRCTKKEVHQIASVACNGKDLYKKWLDLDVSEDCSDTKKEIFRKISGLSTDQEKDCKDASDVLIANNYRRKECTNKDVQQLTDVACMGKDPYKIWFALNVSKECRVVKIQVFRKISGLSKDQGKDCKFASDGLFEESNDEVTKLCTMNELYAMKDIACKGGDPFRMWQAVQVSDMCTKTKQNLYKRLSGNQADDLQGASSFFSHYIEGYGGCTKHEMHNMKKAVCGDSAVCGGVDTILVSCSLMFVCLLIQMLRP